MVAVKQYPQKIRCKYARNIKHRGDWFLHCGTVSFCALFSFFFIFSVFELLFSLLHLQDKQQESQSVKAKVDKESKSVVPKVQSSFCPFSSVCWPVDGP